MKFCQDKGVGLVVVGPEAPLVAGLADDLMEAGVPTWGPSAKAAQLEGSKVFMKVCVCVGGGGWRGVGSCVCPSAEMHRLRTNPKLTTACSGHVQTCTHVRR